MNLIYFVDAAKTKTIRVTLRTATICVGASVFLVFWAISAGVLLVRMQLKQSDLRAELNNSRAVIFEYQVLHDGVFEQAYPELKDRKFNSAGAVTAQAGGQQPAVALSAAPLHGAGKPLQEGLASGKAMARSSGSSPLSLSNPAFVRRENGLEVFFDLRNSDASTKAEGMIWGVAAMERPNGERLTVTVPKTLSLDSRGEPHLPNQGQRFGIRRYARRSFVFPVPEAFDGKVLTVEIALAGNGGHYRSAYTIPVNMKFSEVARQKRQPKASPSGDENSGTGTTDDPSDQNSSESLEASPPG